MVTAGVDSTRLWVGILVSRANDRVKLTENKNFRSFPARIYYGVEACYALSQGQLVTELTELLHHIFV